MTVHSQKLSRRVMGLVLAVPLILAVAACSDDDDKTTTGAGDASGDSGGSGATFKITSPSEGDSVESSFELKIDSSDDLGAPDTGKHHVHVFYDGNQDEYEVVESDTFMVEGLDAGEHTVQASLRNADHSPAGSEAEVTVTVGEGGGGNDSGDDGY